MTDAITWEAPGGDHPARRVSRQSMMAVADGRKDDWLALFASDAVVEDPEVYLSLDSEVDVNDKKIVLVSHSGL